MNGKGDNTHDKNKTSENDINKEEKDVNKSIEDHTPKVKIGLRIKFSLAIIILVSVIITIMILYFIREESALLKRNIIRFAEREIEHLTNTAVESISQKDELPLIAAVRNIQKISSIKYVYILDTDNRILQNFNPEKNGVVLDDEITKSANKYKNTDKPLITIFPDTEDIGGKIYDFSMPVLHALFKSRIGTVRLGFSDRLIRDEISKITRTIIMIAVVFLGISIFGSIVLASITIRPIKKLSDGASVIGTGDLDYKIDINTSDELGKLAYEFNIMTDKLKQAKEMEIESRIMEEQLELAKEIQEGLNPSNYYNKDGIQIKGYTRAAKGVGGDYFDYIDIDDNRVSALISDVSGKGIPASLVMVMIRTVFVSYISKKDVECASVVSAINDSLSAEFAIDKFATLFFMIYDKSSGELAFSNAGHGPLFCYRSSIDACTTTKLEGVPIGIMEDVEYQQTKVRLMPGDIIVLYTDGITEMRNEAGDEYGRLRLQKLVVNHHDLDAKDLVDKIVSDVEEFKGSANPHDDMTILVLKREV
ncbi:MAG: SpoIIE family protein phosphatase [Spirochaetota bacterium]|nr:SpoIIE family protein phosphatase [Spirochaetota bacterium]